ncbi:MAG: ABC transporter permease subunit [Ancrocorticia sp.]
MASTSRRLLPVIAVTLVLLAPFVLMLRDDGDTSLPHASAPALASMAFRSALLPVLAVSIALLVAAAIVAAGYLVLPRWGRRVLFTACAVPFLFPPLITAYALHIVTGEPQLMASMVIAALPYAVFGQAISLRFADAALLVTARDLALGPLAVWRLTLRPLWLRGAGFGWAWGHLVLYSDPGLYEVFGGTRSYLASHLLRAVTGGAPPSDVFRALLCTLLPALMVAVLSALRPRWLHMPRLGHGGNIADLLRGLRTPRWLRAGCLLIAALAWSAIGCLLVTVVRGALRAVFSGGGTTAAMLIPTMILIVVAVPLSSGGALILATALVRTRGWVRSYGRSLVIFMVYMSPAAIGTVLAMGFRLPVSVQGQNILPSLVGGGAVWGGWLGLLMAAVSVCLPLSTVLVMAGMSLRSSDDSLVARDLGAGRLRVLFTVEAPYLLPLLIASLCVQAGMLLTSIAPLAFVEPSGIQLITPTLMRLTASSLADEAFALAVIAGLLTCLAMAGIIAVVLTMVQTSPRRKG